MELHLLRSLPSKDLLTVERQPILTVRSKQELNFRITFSKEVYILLLLGGTTVIFLQDVIHVKENKVRHEKHSGAHFGKQNL